MIWNLNMAYKQQLVGCILIGKVKVSPFVSMIYDSLESTSNPYLGTYKDFSLHSKVQFPHIACCYDLNLK
jgi:hypothetical protein